MSNRSASILSWYRDKARAFLLEHVPGRVDDFDADARRLDELVAKARRPISVCVLGNSAVGKSTLINALVAGREVVMPAGGVGPLTAQATSVEFADEAFFEARYHPRKHVWRLAFILERRLASARGVEQSIEELQREYGADLDEEARKLSEQDAEDAVATAGEGGEPSAAAAQRVREWEKQARLLITGNQDDPADAAYLLDALRVALDLQPRWGTTLREDDRARIDRLRQALATSDRAAVHRRTQSDDRASFLTDLREHAARSLAPLIAQLRVGWRSELLRDGLVLVDLPGVGIANDSYRQVTRAWVNGEAGETRGLVLVVDRGGVPEACASLLQQSGFFTRLLTAADDPDADPLSLSVAVTRVDDVATTRYQEDSSKKKRAHFADICQELVPRIREQVRQQFEALDKSEFPLAQARQREVIERVLASLAVFPVSAPQYVKLLADDDEDRPFLPDISSTQVPALGEHLRGVASGWRAELLRKEMDLASNLLERINGDIQAVEGQWQDQGRAAAEAEALRARLDEFLGPLRLELERSRGRFQEFLDNLGEDGIERLVGEALSEGARKDIAKHVRPFRKENWATLRAAVRRSGTFSNRAGRVIDLPTTFTDDCETPIVAVWGEKILKELRQRTKEQANDYARLVSQVADWAEAQGATVQAKVVQDQRAAIQADAKALERVGREIVDDLREEVRKELHKAIRTPIKRKCEAFVAGKRDVGAGVKDRMIELLDELPDEIIAAVRAPAVTRLKKNFGEVKVQVDTKLDRMRDPLSAAADAIVASHELRLRRSDAQRRGRVLKAVEEVRASQPALGAGWDFD